MALNFYDKDGNIIECVVIDVIASSEVTTPLIPLEDGTTIVDTYIIQPRRVSLTIQCTTGTLEAIRSMQRKGQSFGVDLRSGFIDNLYLNDVPEINDNTIAIDVHAMLTFTQAFYAKTFVASSVVGSFRGNNKKPEKVGDVKPKPPKSFLFDKIIGT